MKYVSFLVLFCLFLSCQKSDENRSNSKEPVDIEFESKTDNLPEPPPATSFLIDHCEIPYNTVLERDIYKGKDSCILRIISQEKNIYREEVLNIPIDKSRIELCEEDYVSVSFACGGPCHSHVFVFTDTTRANEQYGYVQYIEDHPNIIAHFEKEEFDSLIVRNLENSKELSIDNSDIDWMNYGRMDTLFIRGSDLHISYLTNEGILQSKVVSLRRLLK